MLGPDYIKSLTLLPSTLAGLGATANLTTVSSGEENRIEWDLTLTQGAINNVLSAMHSLEVKGFYHFLFSLHEIKDELQSALALAHAWEVAQVADQAELILRPALKVVSRFAAEKTYGVFLDMNNILHQIELFEWGGENCVEHLAILHGHLEELRLGSRLADLKNLHVLLHAQRQRLEWSATHLLINKHLGRPNVFAQLLSILLVLDSERAQEYRSFLEKIQKVFEDLNTLQAVDLDQ